MDSLMVSTAILTLLAGIGVFLTACIMLSSNLESLSSDRIRKMFTRASKSKLYGVGIGTVGTAAIQSSGAMTVMVIGFVNAGIMTLPLAATIIYGANIGTTITAQLAAVGMFSGDSLSLALLFAALSGMGGLAMTFAKKETTKNWAGVVTGFGLLFVGLMMMADSMNEFAQQPEIVDFLSSINNIIALLMIGVLLTALVQSSSVVTTLAITMVVTGLISLEQGIYLTMGSNIGSCIVAIIAGFSGSLNAKRAAVIHLLFNVFGVLTFVVAGLMLGAFDIGYASIFEFLFPGAASTQLAMFHTLFNVITVIIMLPLTSRLINLVVKIVPEKETSKNDEAVAPRLHYLNDYMLKTPPLAVQQVMKEIVNMSHTAMENYHMALHMILTMDFSEMDRLCDNERELNYLNREIARFLVKLSDNRLSENDQIYVSTAYHTISDLERIGDYSKNIMGYAKKMHGLNASFSETAVKNVMELEKLIDQLFSKVELAYSETDEGALRDAYSIEERIDAVTTEMGESHVKRLNEGNCSLDASSEFLSMTSDSERVADHLINMGKVIRLYS